VETGNVRALRPLRVLLATRDRRFMRVMGFLLARKGFEVETVRSEGGILDSVAETRPDILLLDATGSLSKAARTTGTLEALYPHTTLVVVADEVPRNGSNSLNILPKWTSLEELTWNLEQMHLERPSS
jgi:PleD family two-component response regulator